MRLCDWTDGEGGTLPGRKSRGARLASEQCALPRDWGAAQEGREYDGHGPG